MSAETIAIALTGREAEAVDRLIGSGTAKDAYTRDEAMDIYGRLNAVPFDMAFYGDTQANRALARAYDKFADAVVGPIESPDIRWV